MRGRGVSWRVGIFGLLLAGCGGGGADFAVHETPVVVRSDAPFTRRGDFQARVESTIDAALAYWGGTWKDLEGKTIYFEGAQHVSCGSTSGAVGCYDGEQLRVSTRDVGFTFYCVEETTLVHEIGHVVIGDAGHVDPRWMDFGAVARSLAGRPGYDAAAQLDCPIFVSVWLHPPSHGGS
jgi:hypothetical protein